MSNRYWLLLEKSDETRISQGIDGYQDKTGETYHYDSLVPNHKQLGKDDYVVLRKEDDILGIGRVSEILEASDTKIHRRCTGCGSTDIRGRVTMTPKWKCGKCALEFGSPRETIVEVQSYTLSIADFTRLNAPPNVQDVKRCAFKGEGISSQLSILELSPMKLQTLLEGVEISTSTKMLGSSKTGQGFGLSHLERRAVELRAMLIAREVYESDGWGVVDKSNSHPFDLYATRNNEVRYIEVKGTTGSGASIMLTHGEVQHARQQKSCSALIVVSGISLNESDGVIIATGGEVTIHEDPWCIDLAALEATEYRYALSVRSEDAD